MAVNFREETLSVLKHYDYTVDDIDWIGNHSFLIDTEDFFRKAADYFYDNDYGCAEAPVDLIIFMKDGSHFERAEYDGAEWWKYCPLIKKPRKLVKLKDFKRINVYIHIEPTLGDFLTTR